MVKEIKRLPLKKVIGFESQIFASHFGGTRLLAVNRLGAPPNRVRPCDHTAPSFRAMVSGSFPISFSGPLASMEHASFVTLMHELFHLKHLGFSMK